MDNEIKIMDKNELDYLKFDCVELPREFDLSMYEKIPVGEIGALSIPVMEAIMTVSNYGGSGLYKVDTSGGKLFWSAAKNAFIGGMETSSGELGQAALTSVTFNPITLGITLVMLSAMKKLNDINKNVLKIINKLDRKDKATIQSAFNKLNEIVEGYKFSNDKEKYIDNNLQIVNNYIIDLDKLYEEYKDELNEESNDTSINWSSKKYIQNIIYKYNVFQMTVFVLAMATYIQTIFNKDYSPEYLEMIKVRLDKLDQMQKCVYSDCLKGIEKKYGKAVSKKISDAGEFLLNGISHMPKFAFRLIGGFGGDLIKTGLEKANNKFKKHRIKKEEQAKNVIKQIDYSAVLEFKQKIETIDSLYNQPFNMIVDNEYVYLKA